MISPSLFGEGSDARPSWFRQQLSEKFENVYAEDM